MSNQAPFLPQPSGPPGSVYFSQNIVRSSTSPTLGPPPGSVYPQAPQQQAPYGGTSMQSAQPPFAHYTPSFPTPFAQGYPTTNSGPPLQPTPRAVTMPQPDIWREPQLVNGGGGRNDDAGLPDGERRVKSPGNRPAYGGTGGGGSSCCCTVA